jgi:hypothetical protein
MRRVLLIRHAAIAAMRTAAFGSGELLEAAECDRARELVGSVSRQYPTHLSRAEGKIPLRVGERLGLGRPPVALGGVCEWSGSAGLGEGFEGDFVAEALELGDEPLGLAFGVAFAEIVAAEVVV